LTLSHPVSQESMSWEAAVPEDMQHLITLLQNEAQHNATKKS